MLNNKIKKIDFEDREYFFLNLAHEFAISIKNNSTR